MPCTECILCPKHKSSGCTCVNQVRITGNDCCGSGYDY